MWATIAQQISIATGKPFTVRAHRSVAGGCINAATILEDRGSKYFVKRNHASKLDMFKAEAVGLQELARAQTVRVPAPICWGIADDYAFLVLEYLELGKITGIATAELLGRQLARTHRIRADYFGWHIDNTLGSTPQVNTASKDWVTFWQNQRLGYQLALAAHNGHKGRLQRQGERLLVATPAFFRNYQPQPALLHGDLWSGNYAADALGHPVVFDPAVYYGDREADLAMTELFGGFPRQFYIAYQESLPLDQGYAVRKTFYNLYHVLNHVNLFGGGYAVQAEQMIDRLLSEI